MKRNHIYIGGTVLLALLGASGGYYLWAASGEKGGPNQAKADDAGKGGDPSVLPIDVPPMAADDEFLVPVMPEASESQPRYAMNQSAAGGAASEPYPAAGGASALPAGPAGQTPASAIDSQTQAGNASTPNLPGDRYGAFGAPLGDQNNGVIPAEEIAEPLGAPAEIGDGPDAAGSLEAGGLAQGQREAAAAETADTSDLANSLRSSARSAFASPADDNAAIGNTSRYSDATELTGSGRGALGSTSQNPSPPAPITVADQAAPLEGSLAEGRSSGTIEPPISTDVVADSNSPSGPGDEGRQPGIVEASKSLLPADDFRSQANSYGGGYAGDSNIGEGPLNSGGVASNRFAPTQDANAAHEADGSSAGFSRSADRALRNFDSAAGARGSGIDPPSLATGASDQLPATSEGTGRPGGDALEGPQSPQITVQKTAPDEIQVGKSCIFTIEVRNTGRAEARQVRLVDEIPLGTQLVRTSPNATVAEGRLEWEFGTLAPGDVKSVDVELVPTEEGEIGSVATVHIAAAASARTRSTRPQLEVLAEVAPSVMIGQQQAVRITLKNPGSGDATGVMLLENVPDGMSHPHGPDLEFEVGTLRAGESRELELVLTAETKGVYQNRIVATGDGNLLVEDVAQFEVVAPEIAVSVDGPQRKYLELPATFVVAVENRGTAAAKDIELVGKLPPGLQFVSANNFGEYDETTRSVYWSLAELQPSKRGEVTLVAMPVDLGEQRLEFKAGAELGLVDHAESTLQVEGLAALKSEVTDVADPIEVGGQSSYEIRIVNQGSKAAINVQVLAHFPEGIEAVRAEGPTDGMVQPNEVKFAPLRELSPKADTTYRIDVTGVRPGDQRVLVQIMTDDLAQPINEEESTRVYSDQ